MNRNMMRQAQRLQAQLQKVQEELETLTVEGSAGGGVVKVVMSGKQVVESVVIDPEAAEDVDLLQDLVAAAVNDAFTGLASGSSRFADVVVSTADRSGNQVTENGQIKLFNEANPYMTDGDTSWLSIDTRVFRLFEGEA